MMAGVTEKLTSERQPSLSGQHLISFTPIMGPIFVAEENTLQQKNVCTMYIGSMYLDSN